MVLLRVAVLNLCAGAAFKSDSSCAYAGTIAFYIKNTQDRAYDNQQNGPYAVMVVHYVA
jgi:hypothetical protein